MTTRREFLRRASGAAACTALSGVLAPTLAAAPIRIRERRAPSWDLLVKGGRVVDPSRGIADLRDVAVLDGKVARVASGLDPALARRTLDASGRIVTPGLVDSHVHVFDGVAQVGIEPDVVGVARGATSVIDAGSAGATTMRGFLTYVARPARTRVYALVNISRPGMTVPNELADLSWLDPEAAARTVEENPGEVVGVKVRMLAGIPPGQDLEAMRRARAAGDAAGVPVVVHIGGQTTPLPTILEQVRPGDVVTHVFRRQGSILDADGKVYPEVLEAVERGVHLDIGHGAGNLDFDVARRAMDQGVRPTTISSDVHRGNALGPVVDLPTTLAKFMLLGMSLEAVVEAATVAPARIYRLQDGLGTLAEGAPADLTVLEEVEGRFTFTDSGGKTRTAARTLEPRAALLAGSPYGALTG